jgi:hypothetical protein
LERSDHAITARLRRLGLRTGRWRSPHHPSSPSNGGLTPGERVLVEREFRDRALRRFSRSRSDSSAHSAPSRNSAGGAERFVARPAEDRVDHAIRPTKPGLRAACSRS